MTSPSYLVRCCLVVTATIIGVCDSASADSVSFTVTPITVLASPGETVVFEGTISNNLGTGETLDAFSYFFNFNNFNVSALSNPTQILPLNGIDFNIPDGSTSALVELFSVTLLSGAVAGQSYPIDATLQAADAKGNTLQGNTVEAAVTAQGMTTIPEPASFVLLGTGLLFAVSFTKKKLR